MCEEKELTVSEAYEVISALCPGKEVYVSAYRYKSDWYVAWSVHVTPHYCGGVKPPNTRIYHGDWETVLGKVREGEKG